MKDCKVNILGTEYKISFCDYEDDIYFKRGFSGWHDYELKEMKICNAKTLPEFKDDTDEKCDAYEKRVLRHEVVHAFLSESGLDDSSNNVSAWAKNEELIDWIALQSPKIFKIFQELKIL